MQNDVKELFTLQYQDIKFRIFTALLSPLSAPKHLQKHIFKIQEFIYQVEGDGGILVRDSHYSSDS